MKPQFTFDDREFGRAIELVERETGRAAKDSINRAGLHVIIGGKGFKGAMQLTPKATKSSIKAVSPEQVAATVANRLRASGKKADSATFAQLVAKEIKRRIRAIGYTAYAGWNNAAKAFGGRGLKGMTASSKKLSRFGYGQKAISTMTPTATLTNTAPAAEKIGLEPLQKAITNVARDLVEYVNNKLNGTFKKVKP